jgi:hypothetical protein
MCMSFGGFVRPDVGSEPLGIIELFRFSLQFCRLKLKTICFNCWRIAADGEMMVLDCIK